MSVFHNLKIATKLALGFGVCLSFGLIPAGVAAAASNSARETIIVLMIVALIVGVIMASLITQTITRSLHLVSDRLTSLDTICLTNLGSAMEAMADGDLGAKIVTGTEKLPVTGTDEFGSLAVLLNKMIERTQLTIVAFRNTQGSLSHLIGQALNASEQIAAASSQVASGNEDLASRTSEQAANLEETAASMEQMTSIVKQNAENATHASDLADESRRLAVAGGQVVDQAVEAMRSIGEASNRISEIISVIDDIAFQTNLLALNAAVEAARVGEQGRGFAVVAAEVRNLAGRSSTAAKEIKGLVQDSTRKVEKGAELVNRSGEQLRQIVASGSQVAKIVAEISAASKEQSSGIDQVNKAIVQMDDITQQNSALVEQAAAASEETSEQARGLRDLVRQFKVDESQLVVSHGAVSATPPAKRSPSVLKTASGRRTSLKVVGGLDDF